MEILRGQGIEKGSGKGKRGGGGGGTQEEVKERPGKRKSATAHKYWKPLTGTVYFLI